jgi:hypothetical protein
MYLGTMSTKSKKNSLSLIIMVIAELLINHGANIEELTSSHGNAPLIAVCKKENASTAKPLLYRGANVNARVSIMAPALCYSHLLGDTYEHSSSSVKE